MPRALRPFDSGAARLSHVDMFSWAGRFDQRPFRIYADFQSVAIDASKSPAAQTRSQFWLSATLGPLTNGSSERWGSIFGEPRRESMIEINQLRLSSTRTRVAQPHC